MAHHSLKSGKGRFKWNNLFKPKDNPLPDGLHGIGVSKVFIDDKEIEYGEDHTITFSVEKPENVILTVHTGRHGFKK